MSPRITPDAIRFLTALPTFVVRALRCLTCLTCLAAAPSLAAPPPISAPIVAAPMASGPRVEVRLSALADAPPNVVIADSTSRHGEIGGLLLATTIEIDLVDATIDMATRALSEALEVPVFAFVDLGDPRRGGVDGGLEGWRQVTAQIVGRPAAAALDEIAIAFGDEEATWQIVGDWIEIGPKFILARAPVRVIRTVDIGEQSLTPYGPAPRSTREIGGAEFIRSIREGIEPDAWKLDGPVRAHRDRIEETENPLSVVGQWGSLSFRDGQLALTVPPFLLRTIVGFDPIVLPSAESLPRRARVNASAPERDHGHAVQDLSPSHSPAIAPSASSPSPTPAAFAQARAPVVLKTFVPSGRAPREQRRRDAEEIGPAMESLGRLMHARVALRMNGHTAREVVTALNDATGAGVHVWWRQEGSGRPGIDPDRLLHGTLEDVSGLDALQLILDLSAPGSEPTWQRRGTVIEAGPRVVLARPAARMTKVHPIADVLLDIPYFYSKLDQGQPPTDIITPLERRHGRALGFVRPLPGQSTGSHGERRKPPAYRSAELLLYVSAHVEPLAWVSQEDVRRAPSDPRTENPLELQGDWANVRCEGGKIIVAAPDFVHRGLFGVPTPPSPADGEGGDDR